MGNILTKIIAGSALIGALASSACVPVGKGDYAAMMTNMSEAGRFANEVEANKIQRDRNEIYSNRNSGYERREPRRMTEDEARQVAIRDGLGEFGESFWIMVTPKYKKGDMTKEKYSGFRNATKEYTPERYSEFVRNGLIVED